MREEKGEFKLKPISEEDQFPFKCYPGISCFNRCCHEIDVVLTPFDVLRMKTELGITSDEFLSKYTMVQKIKGTDVPLIKIKMLEDPSRPCVFMNEKGCSVYNSRPQVCRSYPAGTATLDPNAGENAYPHFIISEEMCQGHKEETLWNINTWKSDQGAAELEELNKPWLEIVAQLKSLRLKNDQDQKMHIFILACFDLDTFQKFVFESRFLERFNIDKTRAQQLRDSQVELLKFGFEWLQFALFGKGTISAKS